MLKRVNRPSGEARKFALIALFFAVTAVAQTPSSGAAPACGPKDVSFDVKLDDSQHTLSSPELGKARVYFFHENGGDLVRLATKIGMDGGWVGANHGDSYFSVTVEPGEHHVCATFQYGRAGQQLELAHFTAEVGKLYYYRTRFFIAATMAHFDLDSLDSDEAKYLIASFPMSVSQPKK